MICSSMAGRQTPFIALIVPLLLVFIVDGRRGVKQTWPVALVAGVAFGVAQFVTSNYFAVETHRRRRRRRHRGRRAADAEGLAAERNRGLGGAVEALRSRRAVSAGGRLRGTGRRRATGAAQVAATAASTSPTDNSRPDPPDLDGDRPLPDHHRRVLGRPDPGRQDVAAQIGSVTFAWPGLDITDSAGKPVAATKFKLDHLKATGTLLLFSG